MNMKKIANSVISVAIVLLAFFGIGKAISNFAGPYLKGSTSGSNLLENAVRVGISDPASMQAFKNAGGLEAVGDWKGYKVQSVETMFDESHKLGMLNLIVARRWPDMKLASIDNLIQSLSDECGTSWAMVNESTNMHHAETAIKSCFISENGSDQMAIGIRAKNKAPEAKTSPSKSAQVEPVRSQSGALPPITETADSASSIGTGVKPSSQTSPQTSVNQFSGSYSGDGDGSVVEVKIGTMDADGKYPVSLSTTAPGCYGGADVKGIPEGITLRLDHMVAGKRCSLSMQRNDAGQLVVIEGAGCSPLHGAQCDFNGTLKKMH